MNEMIITEAQDYLTVRKDEDDYRRIVDIRSLFQKHGKEEVTGFLRECLRDKEKALKNLILIDKTNSRVDKFAGAILRIMMAIKILEGEEVNIIEGAEQGADQSSFIQKRNRGSHKRGRLWQNKNHDGEDRISGYASQRHA